MTIAGLPMGATIIDSADGKVFSGSSFTLTGVEAESKLTLNDGSNTGPFTLTVTANNTTPGEAGSSVANDHGDGARSGGRGWQPHQFSAGQSVSSEWRAGRSHNHRCPVRLGTQRGHKPRQRHVDGADERPQRADGLDGRRLRRSHGARRDRDLDQCRRHAREPPRVADNVEAYAPGRRFLPCRATTR